MPSSTGILHSSTGEMSPGGAAYEAGGGAAYGAGSGAGEISPRGSRNIITLRAPRPDLA